MSRWNGIVNVKYLSELIAPDLIAHYDTDDVPALAEFRDRDYGVAFELPLIVLEKLFGLNGSRDIYLFRHLITFLVCFTGVIAIFQLAEKRFANWGLGLMGSLLLILSPRLFAESFYNNKDVVFMALFAICLNSTVHFLQHPTIKRACWHSLATAILIDTRLMGVLLPVATLVMVLLRLWKGELTPKKVLIPLLVYSILSVLLVVAFWPYLWSSPWENFVQAFENMSQFRWNSPVLYFGNSILSTELPWHYIPVWIAITTPLPYIFLFMLGATDILSKFISRRLSLWRGDEEWQDLLFLGLFISPIIAVILLDSVLYDGWRQMYFIYPAFVLVALRGWVILLHWHPQRHLRAWPKIIILGTISGLIYTGMWIMQSHPHQNVYFNMIVGRDIKTKFEVDYWGLSSRQALQQIVDYDKRPIIAVWPGSGLPLKNGKLLLERNDSDRLHVVDKEELADYVITQYRGNLTDYGAGSRAYKLFYQIEIDNEAIISVFKR